MCGFQENSCRTHRQNIDATAVFTAWERAVKAGKSKKERASSLRRELDIQRQLNKIFKVGRAPEELVKFFSKNPSGTPGQLIIGTYSLYAYESAAGIRFDDQLFGAVEDLHFSPNQDDPYVARAMQDDIIAASDYYSAMIVSKNGRMARMHTISPVVFVRFKRWLSEQPDRDQSERGLDILQADVVEGLLHEYFPQFITEKERDDDSQSCEKFTSLMTKNAGKLGFIGDDEAVEIEKGKQPRLRRRSSSCSDNPNKTE